MKKLKITVFIVSLLILLNCTALIIFRNIFKPREFSSLEVDMQNLVSEIVDNNPEIKSCVLAVSTGDGSFQWAGAAGKARDLDSTPMSKDIPYCIASITKMYTATAIMILYERGELSLDDPLSLYLDSELIEGLCIYDGVNYSDRITLRHLLSHSSGIADYYSDKPEGGISLFEQFMREPERKWTVLETIEYARINLPAHFPPGTDNHYSDTNYQLLGLILEGVTGKPLHEIYEEFFFSPLEMNSSWLVNHPRAVTVSLPAPADIYYEGKVITKLRENGTYWADGGIISTSEDGIRFLRALNEGRLVSKKTLSLMMEWKPLFFPLEYGMGLSRFKLPEIMVFALKKPGIPELLGHSGSTASFLYYSKDLDVYLSGTLNLVDANSKTFGLMIQVLLDVYAAQNREE